MLKFIKRIIRGIVVAFLASTILSVVALRFIPVFFTPLMFIRCFQQAKEGRDLRLSHNWVSIDRMSDQMPLAVMGSEDANFLTHHGFDFKAIESAAKRNRQHPEKNKLGASTISQQTAKNVFLWPGRSWVRKGLEAYFTVLIELFWTKERIMEVYLNSIETGEGIYGHRTRQLGTLSRTAHEGPVCADSRHPAQSAPVLLEASQQLYAQAPAPHHA